MGAKGGGEVQNRECTANSKNLNSLSWKTAKGKTATKVGHHLEGPKEEAIQTTHPVGSSWWFGVSGPAGA
jgi:hypothetical protein